MDVLTGDEYHSLLALAKSYLPFLKEVIGGTNLGIQQEHLGKLRSLYEMVDAKRFVLIQCLPCVTSNQGDIPGLIIK